MDPVTPTENQPVIPPTPVIPTSSMASSFSLGRIVLISLGVLGLGLAIAFGGYYYGQKTTKPTTSLYPSPTVVSPAPSTPLASPTAAMKDSTTLYTDKYFGYTISYPEGWYFRRTYGPDISKLAPTDVLSGFDITYNIIVAGQTTTQATIVMNMLDSHNYTDVQKWIDAYDLNYPKNAIKTQTTFRNYPTLKYTDETNPQRATEYLYFIAGKYVYRITYVEDPVIRNATRDIVNSFKP